MEDRDWFAELQKCQQVRTQLEAPEAQAVSRGSRVSLFDAAMARLGFLTSECLPAAPPQLAPEVVQVLSANFGVGLVLGASGSGKTTVLSRHFGTPPPLPRWHPERAVVSHFETPSEGVEALLAVGLNTVPAWLRPYQALSTGERCRADLARRMAAGTVVEDEFTSTLDRRTAMAVATAVGRHCRSHGLRNMVFASCHVDIARFLQPDWILWMPQGVLLRNSTCPGASTCSRVLLSIDDSPARHDIRSADELNAEESKSCRWGSTPRCGGRTVRDATFEVCSEVVNDTHVQHAATIMDVTFSGRSTAVVPALVGELQAAIPPDFGVGLIVGPSGTGKSTLLKQFGPLAAPVWKQGVAVIDHFHDAIDAEERLRAAGLVAVSSWARSYDTLSVGEQHRADLARELGPVVCIDEFTSTVDRPAAAIIAASVSALIRARAWRGIVFAACHGDIAVHLKPDWVYDTLTLAVNVDTQMGVPLQPGDLDMVLPAAVSVPLQPSSPPDAAELLRPATLQIRIERCGCAAWPRFAPHHYLAASVHKQAICHVAVLDAVHTSSGPCPEPVDVASPNLHSAIGFVASVRINLQTPRMFGTPAPNGAFRESRLVVVPELQGLGLGRRLSEAVAQLFIDRGFRYTSKAAHPRVAYRDHSDLWHAAPGNDQLIHKSFGRDLPHARRCFNHEYVGARTLNERPQSSLSAGSAAAEGRRATFGEASKCSGAHETSASSREWQRSRSRSRNLGPDDGPLKLPSETVESLVDAFIMDAGHVDPAVVSQLRGESEEVQRAVLRGGSLRGTRNPTAVLIYRLRQFAGEASGVSGTHRIPASSRVCRHSRSRSRKRRSDDRPSKLPSETVESLVDACIKDAGHLNPAVVSQLRGESEEVQRAVVRGGLKGVHNPTAVLIYRLRAEKVSKFLATTQVDAHTAERLRKLPGYMQEAVLKQGSLQETRNPTAVLLDRVQEAERYASAVASEKASGSKHVQANEHSDMHQQHSLLHDQQQQRHSAQSRQAYYQHVRAGHHWCGPPVLSWPPQTQFGSLMFQSNPGAAVQHGSRQDLKTNNSCTRYGGS